jgi:hypothetical protein
MGGRARRGTGGSWRRSVAAALVVWGSALAGVAPAAVDPLVTVGGASPFAPGCNGERMATTFRDAEAGPIVAASPARPGNLIAAWQQDPDREIDGGRGVVAASSDDGGRTWTTALAPVFSRCAGGSRRTGGGYRFARDPWVSIGPDGTAYLMALGLDADSEGIFGGPAAFGGIMVATSADGGRTWEEPTTLTNDRLLVTANEGGSVTADPLRPGTAYAVWTSSSAQGVSSGIVLSRTRDGGVSWEAPREILGGDSRKIGNQIAVLPDGSLVDVFLDAGRPRVRAIRSGDEGETWGPARTIGTAPSSWFVATVRPSGFALVRSGGGMPDLAVDRRSGALYVVWQAANPRGNAAIYLARSTDAGVTWSAPRQVGVARRAQAFTPSVEVAADGTVAVAYFESSRLARTALWATRSSDGGSTFAPRERVTPPFDIGRAARSENAPFLGEHQGLAADGASFHAVFALPWPRGADRTRVAAATIR